MHKYDDTTILVIDTLRDIHKKAPKILRLCLEKLYKLRATEFLIRTDYRYVYWKGYLEISKNQVPDYTRAISYFRLCLSVSPEGATMDLLDFDRVQQKYVYITKSLDAIEHYIAVNPEFPYHLLRINSELDNNILDLNTCITYEE